MNISFASTESYQEIAKTQETENRSPSLMSNDSVRNLFSDDEEFNNNFENYAS